MPDGQTGVTQISALAGKKTSWGQRLLDEQTDVRLSTLAEAAAAFKLQTWQLLVPGLNPSKPPGLSDDPAWPLPYVQRDAFQALGPEDRAYCQAKMQAAIEERAAASRTGNRRAA